jgi:serine protease inhibitor
LTGLGLDRNLPDMRNPRMSAVASLRRGIRGMVLCLGLGIGCMLRGAVFSDQEKLTQANTDFAFKLLQELVREQPGKNIFISPYSISTVLQMVRNGAAGETKTELDRVLGTTNFAPANLAQAYAEIANSLKRDSTNTVLDIANSIWFAPNVQLKPEFAALNREVYVATVGPLDFTDPRSSGIVNAWASQNTHGKIAEVVRGPLSGLTGALIVNAVYFKGMWASRFDPV